MNAIILDGSKHERTVIVSGMVKPSGAVAARVTNDQNKVYFVTVKQNPNTDRYITTCRCRDEFGEWEECKGHMHTGHCYHVLAVQEHKAEFPSYNELAQIATPAEINPRVATAVWSDGTYRILRQRSKKFYVQHYQPQPNGHNWSYDARFHSYRTELGAKKALDKMRVVGKNVKTSKRLDDNRNFSNKTFSNLKELAYVR
jgi:hypothetical protein